LLRSFDCKYIALNPGASYRGLHDSLVNHNGNTNPRMIVCLHEEHAVALAHGYAKVAEKPMLAAVHSNVGLMHASMAIFNAWCDRVPVIVIGATGPVDAAQRRPWIEWIHTSRDQGGLVRDYTKWDDQPASLEAAVEALLRARNIATTAPHGPVYVCLDVSIQEAPVEASLPELKLEHYAPPPPPEPANDVIETSAEWLSKATRPVILMGRVSRDSSAWQARIDLAERLQAEVITDIRLGASFPTSHRLHLDISSHIPPPATKEALQQADVILSLDWLDLGGTLNALRKSDARVIHASMESTLANGWAQDVMTLPAVDLPVLTTADRMTQALLAVDVRRNASPPTLPNKAKPSSLDTADPAITLATLAAAFREASEGSAISLIRLPIGWPVGDCHFDHPLSYLGIDGGGGIGSGPGMAVGAALALTETDRTAVAILGDGDFLMGCAAFWTAARYDIPLLTIVANNESFFNDEVHQEIVAKHRGRAADNRWIGQHIRDPAVDLVGMARAQGWANAWRVDDPGDLVSTIRGALEMVESGERALVDVAIQSGYQSAVINK
jgi:thiamine pyrophosphate-dependent acetolactate synthase large subunit-like protein